MMLTEAIDGNSALAVMLNNLVRSSLGASTLDESIAVALDAESILADVDPPDVPIEVLVYM